MTKKKTERIFVRTFSMAASSAAEVERTLEENKGPDSRTAAAEDAAAEGPPQIAPQDSHLQTCPFLPPPSSIAEEEDGTLRGDIKQRDEKKKNRFSFVKTLTLTLKKKTLTHTFFRVSSSTRSWPPPVPQKGSRSAPMPQS